MNITAREVIQSGYGSINAQSTSLNEKVRDVAQSVQAQGWADRITTAQIKRQLIRSGRG